MAIVFWILAQLKREKSGEQKGEKKNCVTSHLQLA